jgi:hypothetical protein
MAAQAFVQNGARVFIASRKESELKKVRIDGGPNFLFPFPLFFLHWDFFEI